jgi:hypothetical protein
VHVCTDVAQLNQSACAVQKSFLGLLKQKVDYDPHLTLTYGNAQQNSGFLNRLQIEIVNDVRSQLAKELKRWVAAVDDLFDFVFDCFQFRFSARLNKTQNDALINLATQINNLRSSDWHAAQTQRLKTCDRLSQVTIGQLHQFLQRIGSHVQFFFGANVKQSKNKFEFK